ncbi:MAG: ATP synthase subunit I [Chloroflexaceae bacterium]|nr:ATP synthase subunit I [Chloroflexaceae bacterium]
MQEYYQLKQTLLLATLTLSAIVFACVWVTYSFNTALNYLLGACVGVVYLRMLAGAVERVGGQQTRFGSSRLALFVGLMILATRWQQLRIVPIFLGFMTYKAAIILYVLQTALTPAPKKG